MITVPPRIFLLVGNMFFLASVVPKEMPQRYVISRKLWCFVKSNTYGCPTWSRNSSTNKTYFIFMVALFSIQNIKGIFVVFLLLLNSKEVVWASLGKYNSMVQFGHKFSLVAKLNGTEWILCLPSKGQTFLLHCLIKCDYSNSLCPRTFPLLVTFPLLGVYMCSLLSLLVLSCKMQLMQLYMSRTLPPVVTFHIGLGIWVYKRINKYINFFLFQLAPLSYCCSGLSQ